MKIDTKEELEEIEIELMSLKERMARYKIDFKSELQPELKFKEPMVKMLRLNCENKGHFILKILLFKTKNDINTI